MEPDLIMDAIAEAVGPQCGDFDPDCLTCRTWKAYYDLRAERDAAVERAERARGLLWFAWYEFNAIRARHGAPITSDGMHTCDPDWWCKMTEMFGAAIGEDAQKPWASPEAKAALALLRAGEPALRTVEQGGADDGR